MKSIFISHHVRSMANTGVESMPNKTIPVTDLGIKQSQRLLESWLTLTTQTKKDLLLGDATCKGGINNLGFIC